MNDPNPLDMPDRLHTASVKDLTPMWDDTPPANCPRPECGHPFDDHQLLADYTVKVVTDDGATTEIPGGGRVVCPVDGCRCTATWSARVA